MRKTYFFTARQRSCGKVVFFSHARLSIVGSHVTITYYALDLTIQGLPKTCSKLFNLDLTVQTPSPDPCPGSGPRTVGKWAVHVLLEWFLVLLILISKQYKDILCSRACQTLCFPQQSLILIDNEVIPIHLFFSYWDPRSATETVNVQVTIIWKVKLVSTYLKDTQSMFCWIIFSFLPSALYFSMESKYICKCKHLLNTFRTILFRKWPNMFLLYIGWNLPLFSNPRAGPGFLKGGANPKGGGKPNIWPNVPGNCMKKKNSDQRARWRAQNFTM